MTLYEIIGIFKRIALTQPNIRTATDGSIYDVLNNNPSIQYDVFHIQQTTHQEDFETDYYGLTLFYDTRLDDDLESNRLLYQSTGKELLGNIIRTFCENWGIDFPTITYTPYTQRFVNLDCGVYCNIRLEVPKDIICADDYLAEVVPGSGIKLQDMGITITQNGLIVVTPDAEYDGIGEIRIETNVPQSAAVLQDKEVEYTENGSYTIHPDPTYDGLSSVSVDVLVPDNYEKGYDDGKEDGAAEQKAKLTVTSFTENNTYTRADGWSAVTVDVPDRYDEGYADGEGDQKAKLTATSFTENNTYTIENGWSAVTVNVPQGQGYEEGYEDGEAAQKAKLIPTAVTENGTYSREDGFSQIVVNVPDRYDEGYNDGETAQKTKLVPTAVTENGTYSRPDGFSEIVVAVPDLYDEGYDDGYDAGFAAGAAACSGIQASSITLNVASAITGSGVATASYSPSTAFTDIYFTCSDSSKAVINENTGAITVKANGTVTICAKDRMSGLQDCKSVAVWLTAPNYLIITYNVTATTKATKIIDESGLSYFSTAEYEVSSGNWQRITLGTGYTFPTTGLRRIRYALTGSTIGSFAFKTCWQLYSVEVPSNVRSFGSEGCFYTCTALTSINIPNGVTSIPARTFTNCVRLTGITLPNSVKSLGEAAFSECKSMKSFTIPSGVTSIDIHCFGAESANGGGTAMLLSRFVNNSSLVPSQSTNGRWGMTIIKTEQSDGLLLRDIDASTPAVCSCRPSATTVTIPSDIVTIEERCFQYCSLNSVSLPSKVYIIESNAFNAPLGSVTINRTDPPVLRGQNVFGPSNLYNYPIYVPAGAVNDYKNNSYFSQYASRIKPIS